MTTKTLNERQKKFLLFLPLIAVPFLTLFFWALGGGKTAQAGSKPVAGLNMQLPGAKIKEDTAENKLGFYQQAEKDSLRSQQARKDDPYYQTDTTAKKAAQADSLHRFDTGVASRPIGSSSTALFAGRGVSNSANSLSQNEQKINQKLAALNNVINQPAPVRPVAAQPVNQAGDIDAERVRAGIAKMNNTGATDPQMEQLSGMLDKIKDIQNPGLARQKMMEQSEKNRGEVFAVGTTPNDNTIGTLDNGTPVYAPAGNGFYSFDNPSTGNDAQNTIEAAVAQTQTLVNGSTVKLRLVNDIYINGVMIPQNSFVFGTAELSGERLGIKVAGIRYKRSLFPVNLSVYDLDGLEGIYIPGAISRDVAKESADQSIQNLGFESYDPSLGAQAATAGISAAKTLFSRKVRLVKVTVKAGYQVLLKDEKQKQNNQ